MTAEPRLRPDIEALSALSAVQMRLRARIERALPAGISASAFEALEQLARTDAPAGPGALAEALGLSRPAFSHLLARLEQAGWVQVLPDDRDGRRKRLVLTENGARAHRDCLASTREARRALRAAVAPETAAAALPFLRGLDAWLTGS